MRALIFGLLLVVSTSACDFILRPTKTGKGELYQSGESKYDPYFANVHQEQTAAASWPDEAKSSRKPIVTALSIRANAPNSSILSATREHRGDAALGGPVAETTTAETERAHRLASTATKLEGLLRQGEELKKQAAEDRKNLGADKADEPKRDKADEIKREVSAAVDAVETMTDDARKGAKEAEELATKLKAAWTGNPADEHPIGAPAPKVEKTEKAEEKKDEKKDEKKPPPKKGPKKAPKPPAEKTEPVASPAPKPHPHGTPKPPPAQAEPNEVFNP